ncbi:MAG: hypothetical protein KVP17_004416 [Porospora cf. gigantea B]|nr:MAG: hypothetical protein KVP17_004416 [Porospora cf. gigantea B]
MKTNVLMKLGHTWAHEAREEDALLPVDSITGLRPRRSTRRTQTATKPKENNVIMSEGTWDNNAKINVGPGFQVPNEPRFYLEAEAVGASYSTLDPMLSCKKEFVMTRLHRGLSECETMFSPYVLRRKWSDLAMEAQNEKLAVFRDDVESQWPLERVHFPFYPDFALNLLHTCDYDTEYALRYLQSEDFDFLMACKPPQKAYLNKWSPQDRRGAFPCTPYKYQFNRR